MCDSTSNVTDEKVRGFIWEVALEPEWKYAFEVVVDWPH